VGERRRGAGTARSRPNGMMRRMGQKNHEKGQRSGSPEYGGRRGLDGPGSKGRGSEFLVWKGCRTGKVSQRP